MKKFFVELTIIDDTESKLQSKTFNTMEEAENFAKKIKFDMNILSYDIDDNYNNGEITVVKHIE